MNWEEKLNIFLDNFEYKDDIIGVLVCGSYITGNPSSHSDLDVHLILDDKLDFRERGNKIIDGLLIEYFLNPPKQIRKYFLDDYNSIRPMSHTQFITGRILLDKTGVVQQLKEEAKEILAKDYSDIDTSVHELQKYSIWDMLDDLQDSFENEKLDFDFVYYANLDKLLSIYMKFIKYPYDKKSMLGNITSEIVRNKYLLKELPDEEIGLLIEKCITTIQRGSRMKFYEELTNKILDLFGGFDIDKFRFKSQVDANV